MLTPEQCRAIQKAGERVARVALSESRAEHGKLGVELFAHGMLDITGRMLSAQFGADFAHLVFKDMTDRLRDAVPPARD